MLRLPGAVSKPKREVKKNYTLKISHTFSKNDFPYKSFYTLLKEHFSLYAMMDAHLVYLENFPNSSAK